ncbi:MAG: hypothetical protein JO269_09545 [Burkholderiaceae bacterium]|nr:hypothetical protein [Burkholderiaceae bacterium]
MTEVDLLEIHTVGARLKPEPSRALPSNHYGDPSKVVKLQSEAACGRCLYSRPGKRGEFCGKGKDYGKRCEFFRIKKD